LKYDANSSIKNKIDEKANTADLAIVATSGDYADLNNTPTIINNATLLPISASDSTNTKAYIDNKVTSLTTKTDIKSLVTFSENISGTNTKFFVMANVLYIFYQGEAKAHVNDDALFTLPAQYRPSGNYYFPAMVNQNTFGIVELANGVCKLWTLNASATGRVYFTAAIPLN
jgi:hypothetical protein